MTLKKHYPAGRLPLAVEQDFSISLGYLGSKKVRMVQGDTKLDVAFVVIVKSMEFISMRLSLL